jgi:putative N6-adenine-specific DNA methylase
VAALTAFEKRLKRQVTARPQDFFAVTAPGLEPLCRAELNDLSLSPAADADPEGGVAFRGKLHDGYTANLNLRTASRVLMRLVHFKATGFAALEKRLAAVAWELYLRPQPTAGIHVSARHSRLYHSGAVAQRLQDAVARRFDGIGDPSGWAAEFSCPPRLYVRIVNDRFTLSLDTSGEALYRRGLKIATGPAPLRETLAAAVLMWAGYSGTGPLVDPMCGSGTFALEGAMRALSIPPGWHRRFAFETWPVHHLQQRRWKHIREGFGRRITRSDTPGVFASDIDPAACAALRANAARGGLNGVIAVEQRDFFDLQPSQFTGDTGTVVINPPYGRRLGNEAQSGRLFRRIGAKLKSDFRGWTCALVIPRLQPLDQIPFPTEIRHTVHGGIRAAVAVGRIP